VIARRKRGGDQEEKEMEEEEQEEDERVINKWKIYILSGLREMWVGGRRVGEESTVETEDGKHIKE
jgi:hypothetical protein